jgi:hypothetical protein
MANRRRMAQETSSTPAGGARLVSGRRRTVRSVARWSLVWHPLRGARPSAMRLSGGRSGQGGRTTGYSRERKHCQQSPARSALTSDLRKAATVASTTLAPHPPATVPRRAMAYRTFSLTDPFMSGRGVEQVGPAGLLEGELCPSVEGHEREGVLFLGSRTREGLFCKCE